MDPPVSALFSQALNGSHKSLVGVGRAGPPGDSFRGAIYAVRAFREVDDRVPAIYEGKFDEQPPDEVRKHFEAVKINNLGNAFLRWRGAKSYADGGAGTRSAWLSESFARWQDFGGEENLEYPVVADPAFREAQYRAAVEMGWDLHTHTCGDCAMRRGRPDADLRWSLIQAYLPIGPETRVLEEMAEYGIIASCNPVFNWQEGAAFLTNLGEARFARTQPFHSHTQASVVLTSGSHYPVTSDDPWIGMYPLLTGKSQADGKSYCPGETLRIEDALRTNTINGAYLTYEEGIKGGLEVGKLADLVVVDLEDIRAPEKNPELCFEMRDRALLTMVEGEIRYQSPEFSF